MSFRWLTAALVLAQIAEAGRFQTQNFVVTARSQEIARQVAEHAEKYRREKALDWLGYEMPPWPTPCTVDVKLTMGGAGGATSFDFENGNVRSQNMHVEGQLHRILDSVLPHEVTHTVFAHKFRRPLPRWADEGGSVLSEDREERARHDLLVRQICRSGRLIPLQRLFVLTEYPRDVMALYAEGFSVTNYLVSLKGKRTFLDFVAAGQQSDWDSTVSRYYGFKGVSDLQNGWVEWLRAGVGTGADEPAEPPTVIAAATRPTPSNRVARGQNPDDQTWAPSAAPVAASAPRDRTQNDRTAAFRAPPAPPKPTVVSNNQATRIPPVEDADGPPPKGTLIPIAVGHARRNSG